MKTKLLFLAFLCSALGWGQVTIFEYTNTTATIPSGWNLTNGAGSNNIDQTTYLLVESASPKDEIVSDIYDLSAYTSATLTLNVATYGSGTNSRAKIEISYNGGTSYTEVFTTNTPTSSTYISGGSFTFVGPLTSQVRIKITHNNNPGSFKGVRLRNIKLVATGSACTPPSPTFTISPSSPICIGIDATYTTQSGNTSYVWNVPGVLNTDYSIVSGGLGTNSNTVTIKWLTGGNKTVTVGYTESGCASTTPASSTISVSNATIAPTATQTIPIGVNGNTLTVTETSTPISRVWKYGTAIGSYTTTTASTGLTYVPNFATANTYYVVCESTFACGTVTSNYVTINVNTPVITITGTPTLFTYAEGQGPSAYQTLNVSGTSLTDNITIAVPSANWELSTNTDFSAPSATITLNKNVTTHVVASTPVYVRLKAGLSQGQYEFPTDTDFVATSTNAITKTADLDGEVTAPVPFIDVKHVTATPQSIWGNGDATNTPSYLQNTLFGPITLDLTQTKQFYIENLGGAPLTINSIDILGLNPTDFFVSDFVLNSVSVSLPVVIPSNNSLYFSVTFDPTAIGDRNAIISINNNSNNIATYQFNVSGEGRNAEIGVTGNAVDIPNGNTAISATDNTFIGDANGNPANPSTVSQNFVISNSGNVALTISGITISGADASQFSVSPTTTSIAAGATGTITVTFAPTSIGIKNATINIANNDLTDGENPYTFAVQGNAVSYVTCAPDGEQTLIIQNFDNTAPIWNYTIGALSFYDFGGTSSNGFWGITTSGGGKFLANNINYSPITNNFLFLQDLQCENGDGCANTTGTGILTFDSVDISGRQNVKFSFDYDVYQFDTADDVFYELFYDGLSQGEVQFIDGLSNLTVEGTISINIPSTVNNFYFVLKIQQNGSDAAGFDNFKITYTQSSVKTWNGTAWSGDGLPPTASQKAIIDGDLTLPYTLALNGTTYDVLEACECQVNAGRTLTAGNIAGTTPATLNIQGLLANSGIVKINNNSSLVQHNNDVTNTNAAGAVFNYERKATVKRYDYVYWSSPTIDFNMSGIASHSRYYWDAQDPNANGSQGDWLPASGNMENGRGYIFRVPNSYATTSSPDNLTANFTGVPFNGIKNMEVKRGDLASANDSDWNLVGNPYPSAIDVVSTAGFLDYNTNLEGFVYVWTHGNSPFDAAYPNPFYQNYTYNYNPNDYTQINRTGNSVAPGDIKIAAGQGFFVQMKPGPPTTAPHETVTFKNSFRSKNHANNQFYRMANNAVSDDERNRLWLDLNSTQTSTRILVGYVDGATNTFDRMYDASTEVKTAEQNFYSTLNNEIFKIQGKALPFNENDVVPLGVNITATGMHNIALANADGLFTGNQNIYLEDTQLGIIHDLRVNPYNFTAPLGVNNSRFILRYTNGTLGNDDFITTSDVLISSSDVISVNAMSRTIQNVKIYNVLGQLLLDADAVNSNTFETSKLQKNNTTLLVQVTLENGAKVTKKIVF